MSPGQLDSLVPKSFYGVESKADTQLEPHSDSVIPVHPGLKYILVEFLQRAQPSCRGLSTDERGHVKFPEGEDEPWVGRNTFSEPLH